MPPSQDAPAAAPGEGSSAFRIAVRALVAGALAELALCGLLARVWWQRAPHAPFPGGALVPALGFGLGLGLAFALADGAARLVGRPVGLLVGVAASPLAPLGGAFALHLAQSGSSVTATAEALAAGAALGGQAWVELATCAAVVYGPLVWLERRPLLARSGVMAAGGLLWLGAQAWREPLAANLSFELALLAVLLRAPLFPASLALGDLLARRIEGALTPGGTSPRPASGAGRVQLAGCLLLGAAVGLVVWRLAPPDTVEVGALRVRATGARPETLTRLARTLLVGPRPSPPHLWAPAARFGRAPDWPSPPWGPSEQREHRRLHLEPAAALLERAAGAGHAPAMLDLAALHAHGALEPLDSDPWTRQPAPESEQAAAAWLRRAAETGDPSAMRELALWLRYEVMTIYRERGEAVVRQQRPRGGSDEERQEGADEGLDWLRRAAEAGDREAMQDLVCDLGGHVLPRLHESRTAAEQAEGERWRASLAPEVGVTACLRCQLESPLVPR